MKNHTRINKLLTVLLLLCVLFVCMAGAAMAEDCAHSLADGTCTECGEVGYTYDAATNTYTVYTADGLFAVAELVNGGETSINITLAADIVLNENLADKVTVAEDGTVSADASVRKWMPMGGEYKGTFDGGNHTITGLYCAYNGYSETGLISTLAEGATVKNVKIHDFCLEVNCGGAVVGCNRGEVIGCSISGTGILGWITNYQYVGGVVGFNDGTVKDCTSSAALTFRGIGYFGGIVGQNMTSQATIIGCSNSGTITAAGYVEMNVGGITGGGMGTVKDCYNTGSISTTVEDGSVQVGGIAGWMEGTVSGCYNTGSISATVEDGSVRVGGIAGKAEGTVSGCYNIGSVDSGTYSGGIAANAYGGTFADCYYLDTCVKTGSPEYSSADGITEKSAAQFASGEVAYLLNGDQSTITFKQTLGTDAYPSFTGGTVYRVGVTCTENAVVYANSQDTLAHNYVNNTCTACGEVCDHSGSTHTAVTDKGDGTHGYACTVCGTAVTEAHTMDITTGKCDECGADMTVVATVTDGTNTCYAADAATLNQAVTAILETGSRTFTVELPADAEAGMITAIRRAICDTEGVADGSIHLTLKGVTTIPGTTNWDGVAFGPRNAQWDENNVEIVSHEEVTQLASINLPDVTEIGAQAFYFCENLVSVSAPKAQTIGAQAFGYTALTSVEFPELTTIPTDMFSGTWTLSSAKFPKVTTIEQGGLLVGAKFTPEKNPTPFPLELTAEGNITFNGSNHFNIASQNYSGKVDLVLCCDKKDAVTFHDDGTATWQVREDLSYTFKSITFKHSYVDGKCEDCGEDCAHTGGTATCTTPAVCDICKTAYGELGGHTYNTAGSCTVCGAACPHSNFDSATGNCKDCEISLAIAKIKTGETTTYYQTAYELSTAIENNSADQAITLLANFEVIRDLCFYAFESKNTLDLNGHTLTGSSRIDVEYGELTITGTGSINTFMTADNEGAKIVVGSGVTLNNSLCSVYGGVLDLTNATIPEAGLNVILYSDDSDPTTYNVSDVLLLPADYYFFVDGKAAYTYFGETEGTVLKHTDHSYTYTDNGDGTHKATCTACGKVEVDNEPHTIENHVCTACGAMEIVVSFNAGDYEWKTGDTLYFCRVSGDNEWEEYAFTATVAGDGTVTWTPDRTLYWDGTGEHKLVVIYPDTGYVWDTWYIDEDQSTLENLRKNDHLNSIWSGNPTTDTITLNLKHRLAKVTVNYEVAEGVTISKAEVYTLTQYLLFDIDTLERRNVAWEEGHDLWINSYHNGNQFTAFVSPDAYAADGNFIKITLSDGSVREVKMNKAVTFEEGKEYTYKLIITADGAYLVCADGCTNFTYTDNEDGTHDKVCTDCGKVEVDNENHTPNAVGYTVGTDGKHSFTCVCGATVIEDHDHTNGKCVCGVKATPTYTIPANLTATYGDALADVTLPNGFTWQDATTTTVGNAGSNTFKVTYTPDDTDNYETVTDIEVAIAVAQADIANAAAAEIPVQVYDNGNAITPEPVLTFKNETLVKDTDYTLSYSDNTAEGTAAITITGMGNFTGTKTVTFEIVTHEHVWMYTASGDTITASCEGEIGECPVENSTVTIQLNAPENLTYDGKAKTVTVTQTPEVVFNDIPAVEYEGDCQNCGTHTAKLTYNGVTAALTFTIGQKSIDGASIGAFAGMTYNGAAQTPNATVTIDGLTVTGSWSPVTNVGEKSTFTANDNFTGTLEADPNMSPKTITITGATIEDVLYQEDGQYTLNVTGVSFGDENFANLEEELVLGTDYTATAVLDGENAVGEVPALVTVTILNKNYTLGTANKVKSPVNIVVHTHVWTYTVNGDSIIAACSGTIGTCSDDEQRVTLNAPGAVYSGNPVNAEVTRDGADLTYTLHYTGTDYASADAPINAGDYTVTMTVGDKSIGKEFTISPKDITNCSVSLTQSSFVYSGKAPELAVTAVDNGVGSTALTEGADYKFGTDIAINAGVYKLTVTGTGNYTGSVELDYSITAKPITITSVGVDDVAYDPAGYTLTVKEVVFDGIVEGDTLVMGENGDFTATAVLSGNNAVSDAAAATVTIALTNTNYSLSETTAEATFKINKVAAVLNTPLTAADLTYNSTEQALVVGGTATGGDVVYALEEDGTYTSTIPVGENTGTYMVWYYVQGDENHSDTEKASVVVTIKQKEVTPAISGTVTKVYDGALTVPDGLSISLTGVIDGDTVTATAVYSYSAADVGTTTINASNIMLSGDHSANYVLNAETLSAEVGEITKADASITTAPAVITDLVYTGEDQSLISEGVAVGGELQYSLDNATWSTSIPNGKAAGSYTVYYKVVGDNNHNDIAAATLTVTVGKATLDADDFTFTAPTNLIYDGEAKTAIVEAKEGIVGIGEITVTYSPADPTNVGSYKVLINVTEGDNYTAISALEVGSFIITSSDTDMEADADKDEYTYGDIITINGNVKPNGEASQTYALRAAVNTVELYNGDTLLATANVAADGTFTLTYDTKGKAITPAGADIDLLVEYGGSGNMVEKATTVTIKLNPAALTATTATATTRTYEPGNTTVIITEVKVSGVIGTDDVKVDATNLTGEIASADAGTYTSVTLTDLTLSGSDKAFYTITDATVTTDVEITPKEITNPTIVLDASSFVYDGKEKKPAVTSVKDGNDLIDATEYTVSYANNIEMGTATVTLTDVEGGNYTVSGSTTFQITQSGTEMTATADKSSYTYGETIIVTGTVKATGTAPATTLTLRSAPAAQQVALFAADGTQLTDPVNVVNGAYTLTYNTTNKGIMPADAITLTVKFVGDEDMADAAANVSIALTEKQLTATEATASTRAYESDNTTVSVTAVAISGVIGTDDVKVDATNLTGEITSANAGTYTSVTLADLTLIGNDKAFYTISDATVTTSVEITPKEITNPTIVLDASSFVYDGTEKKPAVTAVKDGDDLIDATEYTVSYANNIEMGTATVTLTDVAGGNYTVSGSTTFQITQSGTAMTATADKTGYTYGETITVIGTVKATGTAPATTLTLRSAPAAQQVALFAADGTQLTDPVNVVNGAYTLTYNTTDKDILPAESITLKVKFVGNEDMADAAANVSIALTEKQLTATEATASTRAYESDNTTVSVTAVAISGVIGTDDVKVDATNLTGEITSANAGTYTSVTLADLTLIGNDKAFYTISDATVTTSMEITPKEITNPTIVLDASSFVYDGTEKKPAVTAVKDGDDLIDATEYTVSYANNIEMGMATVSLTDVADGNYTVSGSTTFQITQSGTAMTATADKNSYTYGETIIVTGTVKATGTAPATTLTLRSAPAAQQVALFAADGTQLTDPVNVVNGAYTLTYNTTNKGIMPAESITLKVKFVGNEDMADAAANVSIALTEKQLTATEATAATRAYEPNNTTVSVTAVAISGVIGTDDVKVDATNLTGEITSANAGTYTSVTLADLPLIGSDKAFYTISDAAVTTSVEITPKEITSPTIVLDASSFVYDGTEKKPAVTSVKDGDDLIDATEYTVSYANNIEMGMATVSLTDVADGNYTVSGSTTFQITQSGTEMTATADKTSYTYGETITVTGTVKATGTAPAATLTLRSAPAAQQVALFAADDTQLTDPVNVVDGAYTLTYNTTDKDILPAASITLTVKFVGDDNMADQSAAVTVALTAKRVEPVLSGSASKVYDGTTTVTDASNLTISLNGVIAGDNVSAAAAGYVYADETVGQSKTVTANGITLSGADSIFYTLAQTEASAQIGEIKKAMLIGLTEPTDTTLDVYCADADAVIGKLPDTVVYHLADGKTVDLKVEWSCTAYDSTPGATNTFAWAINDSEKLACYEIAQNVADDGTVIVTNSAFLPVTVTGTDTAITYNGTAYDVTQMFAIDSNAGAAVFEIIGGGTGEGTLNGNVLTITKAGTITIKVTTAPNAAYAAGEATAVLTISKGTPTVTVPTGLTAWYGQKLSDIALPTVDGGAWSWTDTNSTVGDAGVQTHLAIFTPADTNLWNITTHPVNITVAQAGTSFGEMKVYNGNAETTTFTYGETITVKAEATAVQPAVFSLRSLIAPAKHQMALFIRNADGSEVQISEAVNEQNGVYTMTYNTTGKALTIGDNALIAKFVGDENMADYQETVLVTLNPKELTIASLTAQDRVYEPGNQQVAITGTDVSGKADANDDVSVLIDGMTATVSSENVGTYDTALIPQDVSLTGNHAGYYFARGNVSVSIPQGVEITQATPYTASGAPAQPVFDPIYQDGQTLGDIPVSLPAGTFNVPGNIEWEAPGDTPVTEGTPFTWVFTPDDPNWKPVTGTVVIYPDGEPPVITAPAGDQEVTVYEGEQGTMFITAADASSYQWYINRYDGLGYVPISGATSASYTTSVVNLGNDGFTYYCVASNAYGETESPVFLLQVLEKIEVPETGDESNIALWTALAILSFAGLTIITMNGRRSKITR